MIAELQFRPITVLFSAVILAMFLFSSPSQSQTETKDQANTQEDRQSDDENLLPPDDEDLLVTGDKDDLLSSEDDDDLLSSDDDDDLLSSDDDDDLLDDSAVPPTVPSAVSGASAEKKRTPQEEFNALITEPDFPSAAVCKTCHPKHYEEWAVSSHAYAQLSPVFNSMHAKILKLTNGTNGDFCIRCHTQVGMNREEPLVVSNLERHPASREGITCVVCHRVSKPFGKSSGRLPLETGSIFESVYGPTGEKNLLEFIEQNPVIVNTDPAGGRGQSIHTSVHRFDYLPTSGFCGSCHDVNLFNGFRLEEAFSEYKGSPAARAETSCHDCHMGTEPGVKSGYENGSAAVVGGIPTPPRKLTSHLFAGPDYSILHPGIFPHNTEALKLALLEDWLKFDFQAGWGTEAFENDVPENAEFPPAWRDRYSREDARKIIEENLASLQKVDQARLAVLRAGYQLGDLKVHQAGAQGIEFEVQVRNATDGHGVPTGFDAERVVFLRITVTDSAGRVVFRSGDLDPNGDLRDAHSLYVHNGELPLDKHLFNLQSKFITRNLRGGEREQVLAVNYSPSPLPFIRPATNSTFFLGRPLGARKHKQGIQPLGHRWAKYEVKRSDLEGSQGPYQAHVQFVTGMVPVNLIHEIMDVGFDFNLSPKTVADRVVRGIEFPHAPGGPYVAGGHQVLWDYEVVLEEGTTVDLRPGAGDAAHAGAQPAGGGR